MKDYEVEQRTLVQILLMNKEDVLRDKITTSPIKNTFPEYDGPLDDVAAVVAFFRRRFMRAISDKTGGRDDGKPYDLPRPIYH